MQKQLLFGSTKHHFSDQFYHFYELGLCGAFSSWKADTWYAWGPFKVGGLRAKYTLCISSEARGDVTNGQTHTHIPSNLPLTC